MNDTLIYAVDGGVATLTLNRPDKLNAFDDALMDALIAGLRQAERDPEVRCVVLTGAGRGFCAGQDLAAVQAREASGEAFSFKGRLENGYNRVIRAITGMPKPVIGSINGVAAGAGMSLALACDLRVCSERASFIQSFIAVGLVPDSGSTWFLPRLVGYAKAMELAITADKLSAADALALGLVNQVVPEGELGSATAALATRLAQGPSLAIGLTKRALQRGLTSSLDSALDYEAQIQEIAGTSEDYREGVGAFIEKRAAAFKGR